MAWSEIFLINIIFLMFPLLAYLFYVAYHRIIDKKEKDIIFEFALFSSLYLIIRYGYGLFGNCPLLIINIPIILTYTRNRPVCSIILSLLIGYYYMSMGNYIVWLLVIEYIIYYLLHLYKKKKDLKDYIFIISFVCIKIVMFVLQILLTNSQINSETLFLILSFITVTSIVIFLFNKGEELFKIQITFKELEKEKQIRTSIFKITHEIKNPIAVCKGYLDMFDVNNKNHSQKYIPIIKEEIERTLLLLQDFLSINKIKINKDILDVNLLVEESLENFNYVFKEKGVQLKTNLLDDEIFIYGDYNRLTQVVINIIKNGIESLLEDRKGLIIVNTTIHNNFVILSFSDNGIGISEEELKKIREPFYTTKVKGTGLGVSLAYEIIEAHNGQIEYISEEYNGTTVKIKLPLIN